MHSPTKVDVIRKCALRLTKHARCIPNSLGLVQCIQLQNEAELKRVNVELQAKLKRMEERMQKLRAHAEGKLDE